MRNLMFVLLVTLCQVFINTASAGSRGGYHVVLMDIDDPAHDHLASSFKAYFADADGSESATCKSGDDIFVDALYRKKIPAGITVKAVQQAISGDTLSLKKVRKSLSTYRDDLIHSGFDGLLAYRIEGKQLHMYAVSSLTKKKILADSVDINSNKQISNATIAKLLCNTLGKMPYAFGP